MRSSAISRGFRAGAEIAGVFAALCGWAAFAVWWFFSHGYLLYYGDAEAHLNIARRLFDSRTPGYEQIGTYWLPLPHWAMLPFVKNDAWWQSGLAGAIPAAICFVLSGLFLYAATRRWFDSSLAAVAAVGLFMLNPNVAYLSTTAMTEPYFFASLMALLYAMAWFYRTQSWFAVALGGVAALAGTLCRYEGWLLIPFATLFFLIAAKRRRLAVAFVFGAIASLGPLYWAAHHWWCFGDALAFYSGDYTAKDWYRRALERGMQRYPGDRDLPKALQVYGATVRLAAGTPLCVLGLFGAIAALAKRVAWPLVLLAAPPAFYLWTMVSSASAIFIPHLWPFSYLNTRYALAAIPLLAFAAAGLVALTPKRFRAAVAAVAIIAATIPWIVLPKPDAWLCWKESQVNSDGRRAWTHEAAEYMRAHYRPGAGVFTSFGDLAGIFRESGIPLRETLNECNWPHWPAAGRRPELFLWEEWAIAISGDEVATAILRAERRGPHYTCVRMITVRGAPVIEIYRRFDANPIHEDARREE